MKMDYIDGDKIKTRFITRIEIGTTENKVFLPNGKKKIFRDVISVYD